MAGAFRRIPLALLRRYGIIAERLLNLATRPTLMKNVTLDAPFVCMLKSDTRSIGRFLDVVWVVLALHASFGWEVGGYLSKSPPV